MKKYKIGREIKSLDDLYSQEFVIHKPHNSRGFEKVYHAGWFWGWSLRHAKVMISCRDLYVAERKEKTNDK